MDDRTALAALRAAGSLPASSFDRDALDAAAGTAGKRIVRYVQPDGVETLVLGYAQPSPLSPEDAAGPPGATPVPLLVLAACLRLCWPHPEEPLLAGRSSTVQAVRQALAVLGVKTVDTAINRLRSSRHLVDGPKPGTLLLGPEIALWSEHDIDALRRGHHRLPCPQAEP